MQYPHTLKNNIYHSGKRGPPLFFHSDTSPVLGHVLDHSVDKTHVLVVTVELIWLLFLNILSFNFVPTANKSIRFTRFRKSYVNRPVVIVTSHCQSYTTFFTWCSLFKVIMFLFCSCLSPVVVHLPSYFVEHNCSSNFVNSKMSRQTKRCEIVVNKYLKTESWR